jgi:serine/threonine protein kinase
VLPSESPSNNTTSSATLEKRANDPTYDEASYVWFVNSNDIYAVAESANQFQDLDSAVAKLTLSNLNNGNHKTEGGFGKIYGAVREKNGGEPLEGAAKKAKGRDAVDGANLQKSIDSINVASIEGVYWEPSDESSLIFMDKLSENLQEQLNALKDDTSGYRGVNYKDKVQLFLDDIMFGVRDTHASSIAHRDIKLENIMYKDESCAWQLIDFDNAKKESDFGQTDSFTGSELYRAPGKFRSSFSK